VRAAEDDVAEPTTTLAEVLPGDVARVVALEMTAEDSAWLHAVGIEPGEDLLVLRGGGRATMHVRVSTGGEFALGAAVARQVRVARVASPSRAAEP
jgi:Fe2+ transport system protein FeoA